MMRDMLHTIVIFVCSIAALVNTGDALQQPAAVSSSSSGTFTGQTLISNLLRVQAPVSIQSLVSEPRVVEPSAAAVEPLQAQVQRKVALDFDDTKLAPNAIAPIIWASDGEAVSPHSYRLGLDPKVTEALLEYCQETGITQEFQSMLLQDGKPLLPNSSRNTPLLEQQQQLEWHIQRPSSQWQSNAHWISPGDERTHEAYLNVLSKGGFDKVLESIGRHFALDGLAVYHLSFIGVSHCTQGYMHCDFEDIKGKAFNLIIPLILARDEDTEPELDIEQFGNGARVGRYKYVPDEANMVGDLVGHATSAADYRKNRPAEGGEMRMAATVYVADINGSNAANLASYITQQFPPRFDSGYLLNQAGRHWKANDATKRLPTHLSSAYQ